MSETAPPKPKPPAPLKIKGIKITVAPKGAPVPASSNDAALTVLPDSALAKPEDASRSITDARYEGVQVRSGMFARAAAATGSAPGKRVAQPTAVKPKGVNAPLFGPNGQEAEEDEDEVAVRRVAADDAPKPPPPPKQVVAEPVRVVLPNAAKEFMGIALKPKKKSYGESAVKRRFTEDIAKTLEAVGAQLEEMALTLSLEETRGYTKQEERVDGKSMYTFDDAQRFAPPLTDETLAQLDDLFESLRLRSNSFLVDDRKLDSEIQALFKYIAYSPKYLKDKPKIQEKQRRLALKDMLTPRIADTLIQVDETLQELHNAGIGLGDMTVTVPTDANKPYIYEFTDGNTFLPVDKTPESRRDAEARLEELNPFFEGGSKLTLTRLIGFGPYDEEGTELNKDLTELSGLFDVAREYKDRTGKQEAKVAALLAEEEARAAKSLEGTPYEALANPIAAELSKAPYEVTTDSDYKPLKHETKDRTDVVLPKQRGFIPQTRRAFGYFIFDKYRRYMLKALENLDPNACQSLADSSQVTQIYEYQKFVRDYISFMTPYRGVLVYHGLGSGKTCTAIAASEALLSSGNKRIIVMTPFSLRKNFIQQITFCGFRHFRLLNYWTPHEYRKTDGKNALWLFATSVLRIPESYLTPKRGKALSIWIPDLSKPQSDENYTKLSSDQQNEIRQQIYETLVYDPDKGKKGMIWFINYNGVTATRLKEWACSKDETKSFDNSVIVIDEVHNVVRLMQGMIDPYLKRLTMGETDAKFVDPDKITSERWLPKYCNKPMNYKRGYILYRLLIQAKNSKIIGLSGTPLINFPEELGILSNILHGYNFTYTTSVPKVGQAGADQRIVDGFKKMAEGNDPANFCPDIDFYEAVINDRTPQIEFTFTLLPEGYRKIQGQLGVERIPFTDALDDTKTKLDNIKLCIQKVIGAVSAPSVSKLRPLVEKAEPLLPVLGDPTFPEDVQRDDSFKGRFIAPDGVSLVNETVLFKRLSGLISYYKGSRKDLMPDVVNDTVVRVPMSLDQQKKYVAIRLAEIKIEQDKEKKAKKGAVEAAAVVVGPRGDDAEAKKLASSQNYRMASRQACNFVFPDGFTRPRPMSAEQMKQADEFGGSLEELLGEDQAPEASALEGTPEEEKAVAEEERRMAEEAKAEEERATAEQERIEIEDVKRVMRDAGKSAGEIQEVVKAIQERYADERRGELVVAADVAEEEPAAALSPQQKRCLANLLPGESYQSAINRAKECLLTLGQSNLRLKDPARPDQSPLGRWSPKYKAILEHIEEIPGSSLVYSQFLGMEGIGIFTIAMQANGYDPIKIKSEGGQYTFDEASEASIRKGPAANQPRFILFTGGEAEEIRKINIDLFNAKYSELPAQITQVLKESGFTVDIGNKRGELCRVFCITAAGAEGLSLKNVRGVHIMEPYWNDVRMAQVKGRAVRICSHQELPLKDRNVRIYTYMTVYSAEAQAARGDPREGERMKWAIPQEIWNRDGINRATAESYGIATTRDDYALTSDERLYYISERKKKLVENLIVVMKSAAADCLLNYEENKDGTFMCRMLGNEGDFLYHPNLQRDIETSKKDVIGDLFTIPEEELARIKAAQAKLVFREEKEEEEEEDEEEEKPAVVQQEGPRAPEEAKPAAPKPVAPEKRITFKVGIRRKATDEKPTPFAISVLPSELLAMKPDSRVFFIYDVGDTTFQRKIGTVKAAVKDGKYMPVGGTASFTS